MAVTTVATDGERWNFRALLGQGVLGGVGHQLASVSLVLPFLFAAVGGPLFVAGLLVPMVRGMGLVSQILAVPIIERAELHKRYIAAGFLTTAVTLAFLCLTARAVGTVPLVAIFLAVASVMGIVGALASLASQDLLGRMLQAESQTTMLFAQSGLAGSLAIGFALFGEYFINSGSAVGEHIELIWYGIGVTLVAAVIISVVREPKRSTARDATEPRRGIAARLRGHFAAASKLPWLRQFLVARMLFLSVELAIPFFAIHAATLYKNNSSSLNIFVIASGGGLVLGGLIWPRVAEKSLRLVMVLSAITTCVAGMVAIGIALVPAAQGAFSHSFVFVLAGIEVEGIVNARTVYIVARTSDDERPACIAVTSVLTGIVGIVLAVAFSALAHLSGAVWPVWVIVGLNIAAALFAIRLSDVRPHEMSSGGKIQVPGLVHAARTHGA